MMSFRTCKFNTQNFAHCYFYCLTDLYKMLTVHSPQFSNSSKIGIASRLSPSCRNKRIKSTQDMYYSSQWNRANSCKKLDSPSKLSGNKRKRSHKSQHRAKSRHNPIQDKTSDISALKEEFKSLKLAYQQLHQEKAKDLQQNQLIIQQNSRLKLENEMITKELQKYQHKVSFLEMEIERIKKQSFKLIQIEQYRVRGLEENLLEKQNAIANLMSNFTTEQGSAPVSALPDNANDPYTFQAKLNRASGFQFEESQAFHHEKTLSNLSNNSQFISISLTSMMQNQSQQRHELSTRRDLRYDSYSNMNCNNVLASIIEKSNASNKVCDSFKKLRKQIGKKVEVTIDEKHRQAAQSKVALDRKVSKSTKGSKGRLKKDDENHENRSSKKKIMHR